VSQPPSFINDIRPLFTDEDIEHMSFAFDLSNHEEVKANCDGILERVSRPGDEMGRMPPPPRDHWTPEQIQLFQDWIAGSCQP